MCIYFCTHQTQHYYKLHIHISIFILTAAVKLSEALLNSFHTKNKYIHTYTIAYIPCIYTEIFFLYYNTQNYQPSEARYFIIQFVYVMYMRKSNTERKERE